LTGRSQNPEERREGATSSGIKEEIFLQIAGKGEKVKRDSLIPSSGIRATYLIYVAKNR
jgi:hypothetical protein